MREDGKGDGGHLGAELVDLLHCFRADVVLGAELVARAVVLVRADDGEHAEDVRGTVAESVVDLESEDSVESVLRQ